MKTLDLEECADFLKIGASTACEMAANGQIPGAKIGRAWVFMEDELIAYLRAKTRDQTNQRLDLAQQIERAALIASLPIRPRQRGRKRRILTLTGVPDIPDVKASTDADS